MRIANPLCPADEQVKYLDQHFDGAAYALGRLNGEMWYVYLMDKPQPVDDEPSQTIGVLLRTGLFSCARV